MLECSDSLQTLWIGRAIIEFLGSPSAWDFPTAGPTAGCFVSRLFPLRPLPHHPSAPPSLLLRPTTLPLRSTPSLLHFSQNPIVPLLCVDTHVPNLLYAETHEPNSSHTNHTNLRPHLLSPTFILVSDLEQKPSASSLTRNTDQNLSTSTKYSSPCEPTLNPPLIYFTVLATSFQRLTTSWVKL